MNPSVRSLNKSYNGLKVLNNLNLDIEHNKITAILGPNGCGKTTLLHILGGIENYSGKIEGLTSAGLIVQELALFEWMTIKDNLSFVTDDKRKINNLLKLVGLQDYSNNFPNSLSGGMKQKLAIARTLAADHDIILMDEPFSALDMQTREQFQQELEKIKLNTQKTIILVTHDINEAVFLADGIIVLSDKPAKVKDTFEVEFPRPRRAELRNSFEFQKMREKVWKSLMEAKK
ncbi:MAG TPA: ABC transporter ATP-binding protein [Candidatus Nanoarchaeia archaeon]|nr:ABC transporter ATP-binding protein [Candidatus Nanoarchaeia archaeon]